ncbi:hypothetical protein Pint_23783 [Pistacia integerrima]|uniref:Uncharacterized protein n=1 Tax=Pistacia integerrima TaxID=434235 RepID=A0ACC0YGY5_9ROSI|nr:hypothetical protein Pint_23783 [Pistacia integerrima]
MKTSLRRFRGFTFHHRHHDSKDRRDLRPLAQLDEFALAYQDMHDMRDCYDSLLSAAAATANSAYEFSESLQEMGACLLEKTALNDNEESGKVLLMLGKVQFELQKLVDNYRSHIFQTITVPSESLLNELRTVEEMKRQCDEKRSVYDYMVMRQREKGRSKSGKGETFSMQQLQTAHDEYDEEATLFVFRLKSLKQGQSRSLLTQAARHHAAQMCFFKKALKSLEAIEPHVKMVTEQQHIDYQFSGLEDDDGDDGDDDDESSDTHGDGELSFDYGQNDQENVSTSRNSMELDEADITFPQVAPVETAMENLDRGYRRSISFSRDVRLGSQSAPIFAEFKSDPIDKVKQMQPSSSRKFNTYVLPTPVATKGSTSSGPGSPVPHPVKSSLSGYTHNVWHSSPLDRTKFDKSLSDEKVSRSFAQSVLRENNNNTASTRLPPPLADGFLFSRFDPPGASDYKKIKRQSFSGPITSIPSAMKTVSKEHPQMLSGPILRSPIAQPPTSSPKISPSASPTFTSSPKISELHELPRPPANSISKSSRSMVVGHSAPLRPKVQMPYATNRSSVSNAASPLPTPPEAITRSFSIPSREHKMTSLDVSKPHDLGMVSPPLSPITVTNKKSPSTGSETVAQVVEISGLEVSSG